MSWNPVLENAASIIAAILTVATVTRGSSPHIVIENWEECRKQLLAKYPPEPDELDEEEL